MEPVFRVTKARFPNIWYVHNAENEMVMSGGYTDAVRYACRETCDLSASLDVPLRMFIEGKGTFAITMRKV